MVAVDFFMRIDFGIFSYPARQCDVADVSAPVAVLLLKSFPTNN